MATSEMAGNDNANADLSTNNGNNSNGLINNNNSNKRNVTPPSIVDRSIVAMLEHPDLTASRNDGISASDERRHRIHGTSLLSSACQLLKLGCSVYATSCTILHRFYHKASLRERDVWSVAMGSLLLASKTEEEPRAIRHVILVFANLYRRRRLILCTKMELWNHPAAQASPLAAQLSIPEKEDRLRHVQPMSPLGPVYQQWYKAITDAEQNILRQLGFTLYWIPDSHPHKFILYFVRLLNVTTDPTFHQTAWNYCNDSCRLDLCVRYGPQVIACAAIHMAAVDCGIDLPARWWHTFADPIDILSNVCNAIQGLRDDTSVDVALASFAYLAPLVSGGTFNDEESFLWSKLD
jgi:transcription initiation factor TFIIIB Brf1 subunit/transcription initiation factor TFIIB